MTTLYAESSAVLRWLLGTPEASSIQATLGDAAEVVTDNVLTRTGESFPIEPLRTLDAVHIAIAEFHDTACVVADLASPATRSGQ